MSGTNAQSAAVVYGALRDVQAHAGKSGSSATTVPAFDLYKVAREEELTAYRGLCRVLAMHYGGDAMTSARPADRAASKYQRRLLEDLREALCISEERSDLELRAAAEDDVVKGIHRSGVLRRREDFFDGVEDVEISADMAEGRAADDGNALYMPPTRDARLEGQGRAGAAPAQKGGTVIAGSGTAAGSTTAATAAANRTRTAAAKKKMLASIAELGHEAERVANVLLYSDDRNRESDAKEQLLSIREKLLELKEEASLEA